MEEQPVALACFIWAFPGSVALAGSGYILTHFGRPYRTARSAVKTKPRYAGLVPKGSLSLTQNDGTVKQTLKYIEINELVKAGAFRRFKFTFVKGLVY